MNIYQATQNDGAKASVETYSDEALKGAIRSLRSADYLGKWGADRLIVLESEARRRNLKLP